MIRTEQQYEELNRIKPLHFSPLHLVVAILLNQLGGLFSQVRFTTIVPSAKMKRRSLDRSRNPAPPVARLLKRCAGPSLHAPRRVIFRAVVHLPL